MSKACCHAEIQEAAIVCRSPMIRTGQAVTVPESFCNACQFEDVRCGEKVQRVQVPVVVVPTAGGPGTELHKLLAEKGYGEKPGCQCKARMRQMDAWGPAKCREELETIVGWLREEHERQNLKIPFVPLLVRRLIRKAIRLAQAPLDVAPLTALGGTSGPNQRPAFGSVCSSKPA